MAPGLILMARLKKTAPRGPKEKIGVPRSSDTEKYLSYFGKVGKVKTLPTELTIMESETLVRVAEIEFEDGSIEIIPRANLEMIIT